MPSYPTFQFPGTSVQANRAFAPAEVDLSGIGRLADSYYGAQNDALKRQAYQDDRAAKEAERQRQEQFRSGGIPTGPDGQLDFAAMARRAAELGMFDQATTWGNNAAQERERAATRTHQDRVFNADQAYRQQQLAQGNQTGDIKEYQFYAGQENAAGRAPKPFDEWKRTAASTSYGRSGTIVQGPDGRQYSIQFGNNGEQIVKPLEFPGVQGTSPVPLTQAKGVTEVDTGTGTRIIDKGTGKDIREIDKNIAEAERQKVVGKGQGEGEVGLPKVATALKDYEIKNDLVMKSIDRALGQAGPWTTGLTGQIASNIPGSQAHDLSKTLTAIQSNLGFDTLQQMRDNSPTGGALGSITEKELELLQATWGSLVQSQSEQQFRHNLMELKRIKQEYVQLKRDAYERDVARFGVGRVPNPDAQAPASKTFNWTPDGGLQEAQ